MCDNSNSSSFDYFSKNVKHKADEAVNQFQENVKPKLDDAKAALNENLDKIKKSEAFKSIMGKNKDDEHEIVARLSTIDRVLLTGAMVGTAVAGLLTIFNQRN